MHYWSLSLPILDIARRHHHCVCVLGFSNAADETVYTRLGRFVLAISVTGSLDAFVGQMSSALQDEVGSPLLSTNAFIPKHTTYTLYK